MARLKRVREESVRDLGILLMLNEIQRSPTYENQIKKKKKKIE